MRPGRAEYGGSNAVAVLPPDRSGTTAYRRYYRPNGAVLPLMGGTVVPYCHATTAKPDTKRQDPKTGGSRAVLPLDAISGTTAADRGTTAGRKPELP